MAEKKHKGYQMFVGLFVVERIFDEENVHEQPPPLVPTFGCKRPHMGLGGRQFLSYKKGIDFDVT